MKQIFEWLREQIYGEESPEYDNFDKGLNRGLQIALRKVDEAEAKFAETECGKCSKRSWYQKGYEDAEAKWETDCCEWKKAEWNPKHVIESPHKGCIPLNIVDLQNHPYCGHCGKPIKIVEEE